jgi:glycogen debranching enzyme
MTTKTSHRQQLLGKVRNLMHANRREHDGHIYTVPSPDTYPYQWLWDSCYHAIILRHFDAETAKEELRSLFVRQYDNGMLPHMIYWEPSEKHNINWGKDGVSSITQPPMVALAVQQVLDVDDDRQFLTDLFPKLADYYDYLLKHRVDSKVGLAGIINPDESGEDNSPRFDPALGLDTKQSLPQNFAARLELVEADRNASFDLDRMKQTFWVYDVPFNSILFENLQIMAEFAAILGRSSESRRFARAAEQLLEAINQRLLPEDSGDYWPIDGVNSKELNCLSWHIFAPLATGVMTDKQAHSLIHRRLINNDEFMVKYGLRTVAESDSSYDPEGFWRGPVWIGVNWWLVRGLSRYGYHELAHDVTVASLKLLEKSGFREYFNSETGEGLGAREFTWGGLVLDMIETRDGSEELKVL